MAKAKLIKFPNKKIRKFVQWDMITYIIKSVKLNMAKTQKKMVVYKVRRYNNGKTKVQSK